MTFLNQIDSAITKMEKAKFAYSQVYMKIPSGDAVTGDIVKNQELALYDSLVTIIDTLYSKVHLANNAQYEPCYYVKYTVLNGEVKDEYEEYFFLINKELKHRPVNFEEFLGLTTYKDLDDRLQELYHHLSGYRYEYSLRVK